jgi:phosphoserine phosphatase
MPIVVMIAKPAGLGSEVVDDLRRAWDGGAVTWLAPGTAAEFPVAATPCDPETRSAALRGLGIDVNVLAEGTRRKRLLVADMDSTMIAQECIDELADAAGAGAQVRAITARAMNGELDFGGALRARVAALEGLEERVIGKVLAARITDAPGGRTLLATMRSHGARAVLVSGGFTAFSGPVAERLGFDAHRANTLLVENGRLTGRVAEPILGRDAKIAALTAEAERMGIDAQEVLAVGDGANDLGMLQIAGMGVALHAKPAVAAQARLRIDHGDLTALLYLQGYPRDAFAA